MSPSLKKLRLSHPLHLYAHRGANCVYPENTLAAFTHALRQKATHLEMDVHVTRDDHIVVAHDPSGQRTANVAALIAESTLAEVQSWNLLANFPKTVARAEHKRCKIPTLAEVLTAFPETACNIDIKTCQPAAIKQIIHLLHSNGAWKRVLLTSFHAKTLRYIYQFGYKGQTGVDRILALQFVCVPYLLRFKNIPKQLAAIQIPTYILGGRVRLDMPDFIQRMHSFGLRVDYWTINDADIALRLLQAGADGIISDDIEAIRDVFHDFAQRSGRKIAATTQI